MRAAARILLNRSLRIALGLEHRPSLDDHIEHFQEGWVAVVAHRVFAREAVFDMDHTRDAAAKYPVLLQFQGIALHLPHEQVELLISRMVWLHVALLLIPIGCFDIDLQRDRSGALIVCHAKKKRLTHQYDCSSF